MGLHQYPRCGTFGSSGLRRKSFGHKLFDCDHMRKAEPAEQFERLLSGPAQFPVRGAQEPGPQLRRRAEDDGTARLSRFDVQRDGCVSGRHDHDEPVDKGVWALLAHQLAQELRIIRHLAEWITVAARYRLSIESGKLPVPVGLHRQHPTGHFGGDFLNFDHDHSTRCDDHRVQLSCGAVRVAVGYGVPRNSKPHNDMLAVPSPHPIEHGLFGPLRLAFIDNQHRGHPPSRLPSRPHNGIHRRHRVRMRKALKEQGFGDKR